MKRCGKSRLKSQEEVEQDFREHGYKILEKYTNNETPILCEDKNGYLGKINRGNLLLGKKFNIFSIYNEYTMYNINKYLEINYISLELLSSKYEGYEKQLLWRCSCGNPFSRTLEELFRRKTYRCPLCTRRVSNNEFKIEKFLNQNNILFYKEYIYKDCKYKHCLKFDFYLPNYNLCIEVQGEQHYKPVQFNSISYNQAVKNFLLQLEKDKIKEKYCKTNGIDLLKIPYIDIQNNNYKKILSYKLNINK